MASPSSSSSTSPLSSPSASSSSSSADYEEPLGLEAFAFEPRRADFEDLWELEWGTENGESQESGGGMGEDHAAGRIHQDPGIWCLCGNCCTHPTERECVCCNEIDAVDQERASSETPCKCILHHPDFTTITHIRVLQNTLWLMHHTRNDPVDLGDTRSLRWAAFKQFTAWIYGRLGRKVRRVIPACVVNHIRQRFPNPDGMDYIGFIDTNIEDFFDRLHV